MNNLNAGVTNAANTAKNNITGSKAWNNGLGAIDNNVDGNNIKNAI